VYCYIITDREITKIKSRFIQLLMKGMSKYRNIKTKMSCLMNLK